MANTDIVTRAGAGAALTSGNHDQNMKSLAGIVEEIVGALTVDYQDQGKTIQCNSTGTIAVTLGTAASIIAAGDTTTFQIIFKNINTGVVTISRSSTDTIDGATSVALNNGDSVTLQTNAAGNSWKIVARDMDVVDINGGTIDGATVGASSATTGKFTTIQATSTLVAAGQATLSSDTNVKTVTFLAENDEGSETTIDWTISNKAKITPSGTPTYIFTAPPGGKPTNLILKVVNGGAATVTWPASVLWQNGTPPPLTTAGTDILSFYYDGTNYYGAMGLDYS